MSKQVIPNQGFYIVILILTTFFIIKTGSGFIDGSTDPFFIGFRIVRLGLGIAALLSILIPNKWSKGILILFGLIGCITLPMWGLLRAGWDFIAYFIRPYHVIYYLSVFTSLVTGTFYLIMVLYHVKEQEEF